MESKLEDPLSFEDASVELPTKPGALLHFTYNPSPNPVRGTAYLLVCINGLVIPQVGWFPALFELSRYCKAQKLPQPSLLTYDRWSQGRTTSPDPVDTAPGKDPNYGHDVLDVVHDLHQLLLTVTHPSSSRSSSRSDPTPLPPLIFLANSIGCPIARLYAKTYPGTAHAFIFLDSMMANTDFISLWPDPDAPSFQPDGALPAGVSVESLRHTRDLYSRIFHPSVVNAEHLDRRTLATLLPSASSPKLPIIDATGQRPLVVVVGHDPAAFAKESEERMGTPTALTLRYAQAAWAGYNEGLVALTDAASARGPVIARDCSHFVQKDDPAFVAEVVGDVVGALVEGRSLRRWEC